MACYYPVHAYQSLTPGEGVTFKRTSHSGPALTLPCGRCIGCRIDHAKQWQCRLVHEAQMHDENSFLTLTYAPEHLPENCSLVPKHFTDFLKRYRKIIHPKTIRFYHVGEYGEQTLRPHYHAIIFGHRFADLTLLKKTKQGHNLYTSDTLDYLWKHGQCFVGDVSTQSAGYVARYVLKKNIGTNDYTRANLTRVDPETGEVHQVSPEYATMSRKPGIGRTWFDQFNSDIFPSDEVVLDGKKTKVPRYYTDLLKQRDPKLYKKLAVKRARKAKKFSKTDGTYDRLVSRETCKKAQLSNLKRNLD